MISTFFLCVEWLHTGIVGLLSGSINLIRVVEVFRASLAHGTGLVRSAYLKWTLRRESNFVLLFHLIDLHLLLLHDLRKLEFVLELGAGVSLGVRLGARGKKLCVSVADVVAIAD